MELRRHRGQDVRGDGALKHGARVWRVGYVSSPLEYPPHPGWGHRFDDPRKRFRTLYCARYRLTCLRETLDDLRLDLETLQELRDLHGETVLASGRVGRGWREKNVLSPAHIEISHGGLVRLDDLAVRRRLELNHLDFLVSRGVKGLDISTLRSKDRALTQEIAGTLFDRGAAGIVYRSNIDNQLCVALFEGRARLVPSGDPELLTGPVRELGKVCKEFDLILIQR